MLLRPSSPPSPRFVSAAVLLLSACASPPPVSDPSGGSPTSSGTEDAPAEPAGLEGAASEGQLGKATLGPLRGLASEVCPAGPFEIPLAGTRTAEEIPGTSPQALDPTDERFHLFEGPVWWQSALYFSDFVTTPGFPSRILRYSPGLKLSVALRDSGTNGLALKADQTRILGASHKTKSVGELSEDLASYRPLVERFDERPFNSPNDLAVRSDGNLYFTDPDFQAGDQKTQEATSVYRVAPSGEVMAVETGMKNPNGIAISPDEQFLIVAGNLEQGFVKRYPLSADGGVGEGVVILESVHVPDGMTFDCAGNVYVTEHVQRRVRVVTLTGQELGQISGFSQNVTNVAFGGEERTTLFVTTTGGLYSIELPVPGLPY